MNQNSIKKLKTQFDNILNVMDDSIVEFWYARDLMATLGYDEWRNFSGVIEKAKIACEKSNIDIENHFVKVNKMVELGSGSKREIADIILTRYACYLIAQNGDAVCLSICNKSTEQLVAYGDGQKEGFEYAEKKMDCTGDVNSGDRNQQKETEVPVKSPMKDVAAQK